MYVNVTKLSWEELQQHVYPRNGSLPDTYVLDTTLEDWRRWAEWVNTTYRVRFRPMEGREQPIIDMAAVQACWQGQEPGDWPFASIFVGHVQVNCFFRSADQLDGDINPRDLRGVEDHLQLMQYLTRLSCLLGKRVVMLEEGTREEGNNCFDPEPLLIIDQDQVYASAYWRGAS